MSTRDKLVLFVLFGGFATLVVEVRYEHREAVHEAWQAWIPVYFSALAALASLAAMGAKRGFRKFVNAVFALGLAVGVFGLYMHVRKDDGNVDVSKFEKFVFPDKTVYSDEKDVRGNPIPTSIRRPLAAPMGIAGLSAIGFLMTSALFKGGRGGSKDA
ncbi:MAG: hypothetical protein JST30_15320 [Armatimonadetes bacterium]|nr:hypothetical protein [Armatimonadota bacterium]